GDALRRPRGEILQRVHGRVDLLGQQRLPEGADEDARAADRGEWRPVAVALRRHLDQFDLQPGAFQGLGDQPGLGDGEPTAPGAEAQRADRDGAHDAPPSRPAGSVITRETVLSTVSARPASSAFPTASAWSAGRGSLSMSTVAGSSANSSRSASV